MVTNLCRPSYEFPDKDVGLGLGCCWLLHTLLSRLQAARRTGAAQPMRSLLHRGKMGIRVLWH